MQLREIMTPQVEVLAPDATIIEAAQKMEQLNVGSFPICDGDHLRGLITDRDIVVKGIAKGLDPTQVQVRDLMTSPIVYAFEDTDVEEAARMMEEKQIRRLPVLNREKRLVGIVALGDFATKADDSLAGEALQDISEPSKPNVA
jgi:CBS domain-containing protein